ncbi:MAG: bifunctional indole-3-glycerol-phosphate synthase TrpC/phosphoribosylanthranilate isomerase TrpF [Candidatus Polarisedimenticolia bacterium]
MALDEILAAKRREVARAKSERRPRAAGPFPERRSFAAALGPGRARLILECKGRSPSSGPLREPYDAVEVARAYAPFADAVSVLTDGPFFGGSLDDLRRVREAVSLPLLRKDFMVDPCQIAESRAAGADAVLLMLSVLDDEAWKACAAEAKACGLDILTEVHTGTELRRALALDAPLIGINSRDLATLKVDLATIRSLAPLVPSDRIVVAESGITSRADLRSLSAHADAFLVGSSLVRQPRLDHGVRTLIFGEVKVCGLTRAHDAAAAREAGATWGGLVFAPESPRRLDAAQAAGVRSGADLSWAGVFVNESPERIAWHTRMLSLDAVQLHGEEDAACVARLRTLLPPRCEIWKAWRVQGRPPRLAETGADRLLLDGYDPDARGGTGRRFDWSLLHGHPDLDRIIVAGGLEPDNVEAAGALGAGMLDVGSGVEASPGIKSRARLDDFFSALRGTTRGRA